MIRKLPIWLVALAVVALVVAQVAYRLFARDHSRQQAADPPITEQVFDFSDGAGVANVASDKTQAPRSQPIAVGSDLHQRLLAMTEPQRNQVLYLIIRDSGATCNEVMSSQNVISESGVWHAHCEKIHNYSVAIDDLGSISVHPIKYEDFTPYRDLVEPLQP